MGEYKPLYVFLFIVFLVGIIFPVAISGFVDISELDHGNSLVINIIDFIDNGIEISFPVLGTFELNFPLFYIDFVSENLTNYLEGFVYVPSYVLIPLVIFMLFSLGYAVIKLLPTT